MKKITANKGLSILVDDKDFDKVSDRHWCCFPARGTYYAMAQNRKSGVRTHVLMHRLILTAPRNLLIDHINGNGLDNRRENLRLCTNSQNCQNARMRKHNKSGYRGVHWNERDKGFYARIGVNGKRIWIGFFKAAEDAAKAYDKAAIKYHGDFARLNFAEGRE